MLVLLHAVGTAVGSSAAEAGGSSAAVGGTAVDTAQLAGTAVGGYRIVLEGTA
jgi:hypothetical protein